MSNKSCTKDFEVLTKLGQGSFGTVFKVRRKLDKNFYVMKNIDTSQMDNRGRQESINEVKILASLDSPYIVKYFDSFIENKTLHIIMEFCDKGDLSQAIRSQMGRLLPENKIWKYFIQMCLGLEFIHSKKILHRDIKSMNVFLVRDDCLRIGDLGVAKVLANTAAFAHTMVGTPYYLSPELCEEKPYNVKSDVWALGCVLYELCTLKHPFDALNQGALLLKIIKGNYTPISSNYSNELREIVDLCLCKDFRKRPNIPGILNRPLVKERAVALNIFIPPTSVLSGIGVNVPKEPALIYQSQMAVIEEEKVNHQKAGRMNDKRTNSPSVYKVVKPVEIKGPEKEVRNNVIKAQDIEAKAKEAKILEKPRISEKDLKNNQILKKEEQKVKEFKNFDLKQPQNAKEFKPESKNVRPSEIKPKEPDVRGNFRHRNSDELVPHFNNIQFEPPFKQENKIIEAKNKQVPSRVSPKHMAQKLENKEGKNEPKKNSPSKVVKQSPHLENKQKIIKPGVQPPYFMPPQRPLEIKPLKKEPEAPVVKDDIKQVQELPDYPKNKKVSIRILEPVLIKTDIKKFCLLYKPILPNPMFLEEKINSPYVLTDFTGTIDWNFTQTGFPKENIPVNVVEHDDFTEFLVNYAKSTEVDDNDDENDDELYEVSDSEEKNSESNEFNDEESDLVHTNIETKLLKAEKALASAISLIEIRKKEIIDRVGKNTFEEMYGFFKEKATVMII